MFRAHKVYLDNKVFKVTVPVCKDHKVYKDVKVYKAYKEPRASKVILVHRVRKAH